MCRWLLVTITVSLVAVALFPDVSRGQAVQLPTFTTFSVSTTVSVPDRGGVYLGGVKRSRTSSVSRGVPLLGKAPGIGRLFGDRALARESSASGALVTATIIDHRELDAAVLAEAARRGGDAGEWAVRRRASELTRHIARRDLPRSATRTAGSTASLDDIRNRADTERLERNREGQDFLEKARRADEAGKVAVARIYYQMAARRLEGTTQQQAADRARELAQPAGSHRLASRHR